MWLIGAVVCLPAAPRVQLFAYYFYYSALRFVYYPKETICEKARHCKDRRNNLAVGQKVIKHATGTGGVPFTEGGAQPCMLFVNEITAGRLLLYFFILVL